MSGEGTEALFEALWVMTLAGSDGLGSQNESVWTITGYF
jgi:hypothetical protein